MFNCVPKGDILERKQCQFSLLFSMYSWVVNVSNLCMHTYTEEPDSTADISAFSKYSTEAAAVF